MARLLFLLFASLASFNSFSANQVISGPRVGEGYSHTYAQSCRVAWDKFFLLVLNDGLFIQNYHFIKGNYHDFGTPQESFTCIANISYTHLGSGEENTSCHLDNSCDLPTDPPEPHKCPNAGTFVDKTWGREGLNGWSTCRSDNCVVAAQVDNHSSMPSGVCYVNDSGKRICRIPFNVSSARFSQGNNNHL